ncbi:MAG: PspC domain-containing protein, partial [Dysgonamonadaceae bacterium]|nr:PspC domain-containing protein [Dysgonamonadaceae bacterium]
MKKVININFQGQVIAIEETAYEMLKRYIENLKNYFSREEGGDEIVNDIENRIAELFGNRLRHGINVITDEDVDTITSSIGKPEDFDSDFEETQKENSTSEFKQSMPPPIDEQTNQQEGKSLYRNSNDKMIAGVCSGLANYFKIDPVWMRLIFVVFFSVLFFVYILLWIILSNKLDFKINVSEKLSIIYAG